MPTSLPYEVQSRRLYIAEAVGITADNPILWVRKEFVTYSTLGRISLSKRFYLLLFSIFLVPLIFFTPFSKHALHCVIGWILLLT